MASEFFSDMFFRKFFSVFKTNFKTNQKKKKKKKIMSTSTTFLKNNGSTLSLEIRIKIREQYLMGFSQRKIAKKFGVGQTTVSKVIMRLNLMLTDLDLVEKISKKQVEYYQG